jgi:hypothetical protein
VKIEVHRLTIGDSDDPEIIAGFALGNWAATEKGQWCKQHFRDLTYVCRPNMATFGFDIIVIGDIESEPALTEFMLRWK